MVINAGVAILKQAAAHAGAVQADRTHLSLVQCLVIKGVPCARQAAAAGRCGAAPAETPTSAAAAPALAAHPSQQAGICGLPLGHESVLLHVLSMLAQSPSRL